MTPEQAGLADVNSLAGCFRLVDVATRRTRGLIFRSLRNSSGFTIRTSTFGITIDADDTAIPRACYTPRVL